MRNHEPRIPRRASKDAGRSVLTGLGVGASALLLLGGVYLAGVRHGANTAPATPPAIVGNGSSSEREIPDAVPSMLPSPGVLTPEEEQQAKEADSDRAFGTLAVASPDPNASPSTDLDANNMPNNGSVPGDGPALTYAVRNAPLESLEGKKMTLGTYTDKPMIVELFASWCPTCREQAPHMTDLQNELGDKAEILALTTEDSTTDHDKVQRFADDAKASFVVGFIPRETALLFAEKEGDGIPIPQTLVVSPSGHVLKQFIGYSPSDLDEAKRLVLAMTTK